MKHDTPHSGRRGPIEFRTDLAPLPPPAWFAGEVEALGVVLDGGDAGRLGLFLALLLDANTKANLTAITDPEDAWRKHILDSITLIPLLAELPAGARVADVGSGGGVPGIPLAVCQPALRFYLIEATRKKADFLRTAAEALALGNVEVVNQRAEAVGQDHKSGLGRESFDAVIARALGSVTVAAELTVPLAKVGGRVLLIKGEKAEAELAEARRALDLLGAVFTGVVATPTGRIVVLDKAGPTPRPYPRPAGEPKRRPLK